MTLLYLGKGGVKVGSNFCDVINIQFLSMTENQKQSAKE